MCSKVIETKCECWQPTSEQTAMNSTLSIFFRPWLFFRRPLLPSYPDFLTAVDSQLVLNIFLLWPSPVLSFQVSSAPAQAELWSRLRSSGQECIYRQILCLGRSCSWSCLVYCCFTVIPVSSKWDSYNAVGVSEILGIPGVCEQTLPSWLRPQSFLGQHDFLHWDPRETFFLRLNFPRSYTHSIL